MAWRFNGTKEVKASQATVGPGPARFGTARRLNSERDFNSMSKVVNLADVTNGAEALIEMTQPYRVSVAIEGHADLLFHRWNAEAVEAKASAAKGSKAKKTDDIESYVWRTDDGQLALPGEYLRGSLIAAAKYHQDPRSPRKSAMDLFKAGVVSLTPLAPLGVTTWDYEDKRRVVVQRNGVNRVRPALRTGWKAEFIFMVTTPEYIAPTFLHQVLSRAGLLVGVGDFRPTYGRFGVVGFGVIEDEAAA